MIEHAVIPAAGLGTRLLPASKNVPKEMFPLPRNIGGRIILYPTLQIIYEKLFKLGIRNFCFVVNQEKRDIRKYFKPDYPYINMLKKIGREKEASEFLRFYRELEKSDIKFVSQEKPLGVGDAVLRCKRYVGKHNFLLNMGDDFILNSKNNSYRDLIDTFFNENADACVFIMHIENPKHYGVIKGEPINSKIYKIKKIIEKPNKLESNLAIVGTYVFKPIIFNIMKNIREKFKSWELTDAVQELINKDGCVLGYLLDYRSRRIDIGRPSTYIDAFTELLRKEF